MVQTHADINNRENYTENFIDFEIVKYYISLDKKYVSENKQFERAINNLKKDLFQKISTKRNETIKERPEYFETFLNFVINYPNSQCIEIEEILENHYKRPAVYSGDVDPLFR